MHPRSPERAVEARRAAQPTVCRQVARIATAFSLIALAACSSDGDGTSSAPSFPSIAVAITSPVALSNTTGVVKFSGTLTPSEPTVSGLKVDLKVKGKLVGSATGGSFSVDVDTTQKDAKGKVLFKDGKVCVTFSAVGSQSANGSASHCITSDNSDPKVVMTSPEANSVHIGRVTVTGNVSEKYLKETTIAVDGKQVVGYCNEKVLDANEKPVCSLKDCIAKFGSCLKGSGGFNLEIDRSNEQTKEVTIAITSTDLTNHTTKVERKVRILRPPTWDTTITYDGMTRQDRIAGQRGDKEEKLGKINDMLVYDFDRDGALDALVCSVTGMWLLPGDTEDGESPKGTGKFLPAVLVSPARITRMVLVDIDGDKIKDVFGAGATEDTANPGSVGIALLTKKGGIKQVAQVTLAGEVRAITTGDMDRNLSTDLVVGAAQDEFAVQIVPTLAPADIKCPSKEAPNRLCKEVVEAKNLGPAELFGTPEATPMSGGISSITVGDFFISGKQVYPDVVVGRGTSRTITICENNEGTLLGCKDTQPNDFTADMTDTAFMVPVDWNTDGKLDLIVASVGSGLVRWLASTGNGKFTYEAGKSRDIKLSGISSLSIGPVGPSKKDYVMVGHGERTVSFVPVLLDDKSHRDKCFRSWIMGGSVSGMDSGDMDGDGDVELIAIDSAPNGIAVALGKGDGNYHAATVHRLCGLRKGGFQFATLPVSKFKLRDVSGDTKPDLLMISDAVTSLRSRLANMCQSKTDKTVFLPQPAHVLHLYVNEGTSLEEAARAGEWGPYTSPGLQVAHGVREIGEGTCGVTMPNLSAMEIGEFSGVPPLDMVLARSQSYDVGTPPDAKGECPFKEQNEIANLFGLQKGGTADVPGPTCKNFRDEDEDKKAPLQSVLGGAPLARASVVTFINANPAAPFGLTVNNRPDDPVEIRPRFMFAGGRSPISLAVGRFDKDDVDDIATLMAAEGTAKEKEHMPGRVRVFRSISAKEGGIVKPVLYFTSGTSQGEVYASENKNTQKLPINVDAQDWWQSIDTLGFNGPKIDVSYLIPAGNPKKLRAARYCKTGPLTSLFTFNEPDTGTGSFSVMRAQGSLVLDPATTYNTGIQMQGFGVVDVDGNKCTDVVYAKAGQLGYAEGLDKTFKTNKYVIPNELKNLTAVEVFDVNNDGTLDMVLVDATTDVVRFFLNDGLGNFVPVPETMPVLRTSSDLQIGDINGDGCNDLAVQGKDGVAIVMSLGCK